MQAYLDGAENPQNQSLKDDQGRRADPEGKVDAQVLPDIRISTRSFVYLN